MTLDVESWVQHTRKYYGQCAFGIPFSGKPLYPDYEAVSTSPSSSTQTTLALSIQQPQLTM